MEIEKRQIAYNRVVRNEGIRYIVIHDTANTAKGSDADAHFRYFNGGDRSASADFFVDDKRILQVNDYTAYYTWHVGDGKGKYGITNANSVGIELCVNCDGDYNKAFCNAVWLAKQLMAELGVPFERVVRHYDASRKKCPASMSGDDWALWKNFQQQLKEGEHMAECKFSDIEGHYAKQAICDLFYMGIVNGVDETHFAPDDAIKRADVAIIARNIIRYIMGK